MGRGLLTGLRRRGVDVVTVQEERRRGQPDIAQLEWATRHGRVLYTKNAGDFQRLHTEILLSERHHAGIIVLTGRSISVGHQLRGLFTILDGRTAEEMIDALEYLSNWR